MAMQERLCARCGAALTEEATIYDSVRALHVTGGVRAVVVRLVPRCAARRDCNNRVQRVALAELTAGRRN